MMRRSINVHFRAESVRRLVARRSSQQPAAAFVLALSEECEFRVQPSADTKRFPTSG